MSTKLPGSTYVPAFAQVWRTRSEWQEIIAEEIKAGGSRRVEYGETFIHGKNGILRHEIYANVPAPAEIA